MADKHNSYHESRLFRLPKELREHIFTHLFSITMTHLTPKMVEPHLTMTCRTLRKESLPVFYRTMPLQVDIIVNCDSHGNVWLKTDRWYHRLPLHRFQHIRHWTLSFQFRERYFGEPVMIRFEISLSKKRPGYSMRHSFGAGWFANINRKGDPADCEEVVLMLQNHLEKSLDMLLAHPGVGNFQAEHVDSLIDSIDTRNFP